MISVGTGRDLSVEEDVVTEKPVPRVVVPVPMWFEPSLPSWVDEIEPGRSVPIRVDVIWFLTGREVNGVPERQERVVVTGLGDPEISECILNPFSGASVVEVKSVKKP